MNTIIIGDPRTGGSDGLEYLGIGDKLGRGFDPIRGGMAVAERDETDVVCPVCGENIDEFGCCGECLNPRSQNEDDPQIER